MSRADEKLRLLVIDKSPKFRCFKTSRLLSIAWVRSRIFQRPGRARQSTLERLRGLSAQDLKRVADGCKGFFSTFVRVANRVTVITLVFN